MLLLAKILNTIPQSTALLYNHTRFAHMEI